MIHVDIFSRMQLHPCNGPLHYKISSSSSELFGLSSTDLLTVFVKFQLYALVRFIAILYHHVGGVCTSQATREE